MAFVFADSRCSGHTRDIKLTESKRDSSDLPSFLHAPWSRSDAHVPDVAAFKGGQGSEVQV